MARAQHTYSVRLAVDGGGRVKAELLDVGQSGERSLKRIETQGRKTSLSLGGLTDKARLLGAGMRTLGGALIGVTSVAGLAGFADRAISAADAIGKTADKIGVGVEALQELRYAAQSAGVEQQTLDMALQRFTRRAAEAAQGTGEARDALAQMGIQLRDQSGNLRSTDDLLGQVADAFAKIEDPAERVRLAFKLFDSEGAGLVNMLRDGRVALDDVRERARDLGIVLGEDLVRDAERARNELDTLGQVLRINLTRAILEVGPHIADLSTWLANAAANLNYYLSSVERLSDANLQRAMANHAETVRDLQSKLRDTHNDLIPDVLQVGDIARLERRIKEETDAYNAAVEEYKRRQALPAPSGATDAAGVAISTPGAKPAPSGGSRTGGSRGVASAAIRDAEREAREQQRAREEALRTLDQIRDAYLRANGEQIALIARRRDRELEALDDLALSEEELAEARTKIVATAAEEIADINARAAEKSTVEWEQFGRGLVGVFTTAATSADNFFDALTEGLLRFATQQGQSLLNKGLEGLLDIIGGAVGGLLGGGGASFDGIRPATIKPPAPALSIHAGGRIGIDPIPRREAPAALWAHAPRLHGGLASDEYPAILQRGETVVPRGATPEASSLQVVVNNNAGAKVTPRQTGRGRYEIDIDEAVADAIAFGRATPRALDQHGRLTRY